MPFWGQIFLFSVNLKHKVKNSRFWGPRIFSFFNFDGPRTRPKTFFWLGLLNFCIFDITKPWFYCLDYQAFRDFQSWKWSTLRHKLENLIEGLCQISHCLEKQPIIQHIFSRTAECKCCSFKLYVRNVWMQHYCSMHNH